MKVLFGGYDKKQFVAWGEADSWHIVGNGPCYGLWNGGVFIGNCDRTERALADRIAYIEKYHMNKESI